MTSPSTNLEIPDVAHAMLVPNVAIRGLLLEFQEAKARVGGGDAGVGGGGGGGQAGHGVKWVGLDRVGATGLDSAYVICSS